MAIKKTPIEIFENMDYPEDNVSLNSYEVWLELEETKRLQCGKGAVNTTTNSALHWHFTSPEERGNVLLRCVDNLINCKQLLIECLCHTAFTINDSKTTVEALIEQIHYFALKSQLIKQDKENTFELMADVFTKDIDIPMIGQILGPILAAGGSIHLVVNEDNKFFNFFCILIEAFKSSTKIPEGTFSIIDSVEAVNHCCICITNESSNYYCPMIVHEDSDVDSAVESVIQGAWNFGGSLTWSLTHIYIQESIFDSVARKLAERIKLMKHGSRLNKGTTLCEDPNFKKQMNFDKMEVFQAFENCCHIMYIGWDPSVTESYQPKTGISLLPFRTVNEAIALVNQSRYTFCASVWTERISTALYMSEKLEVGTVWINSHGLLNSKVPFESRKEFKYSLNGDNLLHFLTNYNLKVGETDSIKINTGVSRKDICTVVESAKSAQKLWLSVGSRNRCKKIASVFKGVNMLPESISNPALLSKLSYAQLVKETEWVSSETWSVNNGRVIYSYEPFGIVWVTLPYVGGNAMREQLLLLIATILVHGNSVIVYTPDEKTEEFATNICSIFKLCELPSRSISIVSGNISDSELYLKIIKRFITLGGTKCSCLLKMTFGENIDLPVDNMDFEGDKSLVFQRKVTWIPNK